MRFRRRLAMRTFRAPVLAMLGMALSAPGGADTGKLPLTGGVSSISGAAGGGLTPWAVIGTNAAEGEIGVSAFATRLRTRDYGLTSSGLALGLYDRVELSVARQDFGAAPASALNAVAPFGVEPDLHLKMDIIGAKVRLAGDAILDTDSPMPQISVGVEHKRLHPASAGGVIQFLGADTEGTDVYVSATKLLLDRNLLVHATLRSTNANQNGLLGFGGRGPARSGRSLQPEFSVAYLLRRDLAVGAEWRFKPDNLRALGRAAGLGDALREDDWRDIFVVWAPSKHLSVTLAYVDLGRVVPGVTAYRRQRGAYLSLQAAY
ncbi:DUF3034 domain-containing protein [Paracidovorax avenae]|uniref:DUF3034 family protein n=1 Tax=Paracidovorax avenae TaxID=80867 RepID=UPI000D16CF94|nr:DUF3034 family protein [Paracidovorax avenae]AVS64183.1 DUF3034 domain-containing protein [Paracidovorax avenae]AVS78428.1 DUF3034 domain-containing protein [Paracidovorax avenae]AVS99650.1 DUF3034 domain-containing protein [Paracidovorax avenae]AVT06705.1 DUF3034 domain-containing protein [Paracidovorax avenae]AVT21071.1 DUF3034 domain-containing protein [Paracidovorax avenae]